MPATRTIPASTNQIPLICITLSLILAITGCSGNSDDFDGAASASGGESIADRDSNAAPATAESTAAPDSPAAPPAPTPPEDETIDTPVIVAGTYSLTCAHDTDINTSYGLANPVGCNILDTDGQPTIPPANTTVTFSGVKANTDQAVDVTVTATAPGAALADRWQWIGSVSAVDSPVIITALLSNGDPTKDQRVSTEPILFPQPGPPTTITAFNLHTGAGNDPALNTECGGLIPVGFPIDTTAAGSHHVAFQLDVPNEEATSTGSGDDDDDDDDNNQSSHTGTGKPATADITITVTGICGVGTGANANRNARAHRLWVYPELQYGNRLAFTNISNSTEDQPSQTIEATGLSSGVYGVVVTTRLTDGVGDTLWVESMKIETSKGTITMTGPEPGTTPYAKEQRNSSVHAIEQDATGLERTYGTFSSD